MGYVVFLIFVASSFTLTSTTDVEEKSHDIWLLKMEKPELNPNWLTDISYKLKKINKYGKALDLNVSLLQEINEDVLCQGRIFEKRGGKYVKAPLDFPETPCCELMKNNKVFWPCVRDSSNFPKECPITKGIIEMKDFNPDVCDYPTKLPPNLPEEYKGEFTGTIKSEQIWKYVIYGVLKKRMAIA